MSDKSPCAMKEESAVQIICALIQAGKIELEGVDKDAVRDLARRQRFDLLVDRAMNDGAYILSLFGLLTAGSPRELQDRLTDWLERG